MEWMAASLYLSGFSDNNLSVINFPLGDCATISVKVPPLSIQKCHLLITDSYFVIRFEHMRFTFPKFTINLYKFEYFKNKR